MAFGAPPPQRQFGLSEIVEIALSNLPELSPYRVFGAAAMRGGEPDPEMVSALPSAFRVFGAPPGPNLRDSEVRMLGTDLGRRSVEIIRNVPRTIAAIRRISLETIAGSLRENGLRERILVMDGNEELPPVAIILSGAVRSIFETRLVSDDIPLEWDVLVRAFRRWAEVEVPSPEQVVYRQTIELGRSGLAELFWIAKPEIILTRSPRMVPLCVPLPHLRVERGAQYSTAGVLCRDSHQEVGVTACFHGTGPVGTLVDIGLHRLKVKLANATQDIVFIPLTGGLNYPQLRGMSGVRKDREPARSDPVYFDGATNQNSQTRILSADAGLLRARPTIMLKVQTGPDTDQGDSGCALIDRDDKVLAFAFEKTDIEEFPQFTDWIWAANALRALNLEPINVMGP